MSPAPLGGAHPRTVFIVGAEYPVEPGEIHPGLWYQGRQPRDETQRLKDDLRGAVLVRRLVNSHSDVAA